ncbi:TPA_asm: M [Cuscuta gammacytorhabdovirus 2]|nr:TPA_asm: M [Cuscuta gammacytorhabdovirus 2]
MSSLRTIHLQRTDRELSLIHYYISLEGRISVTGLRYVSVEEIYSLMEGEFGVNDEEVVKDLIDLSMWAVEQNVPSHISEELTHSAFFGPLSPNTVITPPDEFFIMTDRTSFPNVLTKGRLDREGMWNLRGEEFKLTIDLRYEITHLTIDDPSIGSAPALNKYVRSDYYNWRYRMGRAPRALEIAGDSD